MTTPKNYRYKGPTFRERLRCPLCGKLSRIGYFSLKHLFGVYRYRYGGKGDISVTFVDKGSIFTSSLIESFRDRFLSLLEEFAGCKYYSQFQMDEVIEKYEKLFAEKTLEVVPKIIPSIRITSNIEQPNIRPNIIPATVVIE